MFFFLKILAPITKQLRLHMYNTHVITTSPSLTPIWVQGSGDWAVRRLLPGVVSSGLRRRRGRSFTLDAAVEHQRTFVSCSPAASHTKSRWQRKPSPHVGIDAPCAIFKPILMRRHGTEKQIPGRSARLERSSAVRLFTTRRRFEVHMVPYGLIISH